MACSRDTHPAHIEYDRRVSRPPQGAEALSAHFTMKLSLRTLFLLLLSGAGFVGVLAGLNTRNTSTILFGGVLMWTAMGLFMFSHWRDEKDFPHK